MATPKQEVLERRAGILDTAYERVDENQVVTRLLDRIKSVSWELRSKELVRILKEIRVMRRVELTFYLRCLKEAVRRFKLFPELNAAVTELKDDELVKQIREARSNGTKKVWS